MLEISIAAPARQLSDMMVGSDGENAGFFRDRGGAGGFGKRIGVVSRKTCCWLIPSGLILLDIPMHDDAEERRESASHGSEKSNWSVTEWTVEPLLFSDDADADRLYSRLAGSEYPGGETCGAVAERPEVL